LSKNAIIIGNSDGIGFVATRKLLERGWHITGISRSTSPLEDPAYQHFVSDVCDNQYTELLKIQAEKLGHIDLCLYCAGIGELLNFDDMQQELTILDVNLTGMLKTVAVIIPAMIINRKGHFVGISSVADILVSGEAPAYHASKAAVSNYLEGLALATRPFNIYITNLRFGFVDTKMAKGDIKPFMITVEHAAEHVLKCLQSKPIRYTAPKIVIPFVALRKWMMRISGP
jgi:short-subunit dehydrogenase